MAKLHIRRTIIFVILGIIAGLIYVGLIPKVYEGAVQLVVGTPITGPYRNYASNLTEDVAGILNVGLTRNPLTEINILRGRSLFAESLQIVAQRHNDPDMMRDWEGYYSMYDVLGEKDSDAAIIQARAYTPEIAADLANTISERYNEARQKAARATVGSALQYLEGQIQAAETDLTVALNKRKEFKEQAAVADLVSATGQAQMYEVQVKANLNAALTMLASAEGEAKKAKAELARWPQRQDGERVEQRNPVLISLETRLAELNMQRAQLLAQYLDDAIVVKSIDESIRDVKSQIVTAKKQTMQPSSRVDRVDPTHSLMEQAYAQAIVRVEGLRDQVSELQNALDDHQARLKSLPAIEQSLADLDRDVQIRENNVRTLSTQRENIKNRTEITGRASQVLFQAVPNDRHVFPDPLVVGLLSIFGGAALGLLYSFTVESLRLRIYTSYQLADLTGLPVMASVPKLPPPAVRQLASSFSTGSPRIMESLRLLAFSLVAQPHEGCRRLLFTGLDRQSGVTLAAAQLGVALGHTGAKVILVDGDLSGRYLSRTFKAETQRGFGEALSTNEPFEAIEGMLKEAGDVNVRILPAGVSNDRALRECETKRLEEVLGWLAGQCDYLVFDCPPCLRHSEAARLAAETDEAYLVVSLRIASVPLVSAALDILRQAGAQVVRLLATEGDRGEEGLAREARVTAAGKALPS